MGAALTITRCPQTLRLQGQRTFWTDVIFTTSTWKTFFKILTPQPPLRVTPLKLALG